MILYETFLNGFHIYIIVLTSTSYTLVYVLNDYKIVNYVKNYMSHNANVHTVVVHTPDVNERTYRVLETY